MYTFVQNLRTRDGLLVEAPALCASWLIAEFFYKFHSFTLECAAFLATWWALSSVLALTIRRRPTGG
jgi:hypothetical protein